MGSLIWKMTKREFCSILQLDSSFESNFITLMVYKMIVSNSKYYPIEIGKSSKSVLKTVRFRISTLFCENVKDHKAKKCNIKLKF